MAAEPHEIAEAAAWLLSDRSSYVTWDRGRIRWTWK
jgi:NAD(P)-dependent dehydrogenase (short-subunit alcohol dehydrogenase family)